MVLKNSSLERGLSVLSILEHSEDALGIREIARRVELSAAAVQRIVNTLCEHDYVQQSVDTQRYSLGSAVLSLAKKALRRDNLVAIAEPILTEIVATSVFNAFLGIRRRASGVYLLALQSQSPVVIRSSPGDEFLLHSTALGKALLMDHREDELISLIGPGPYRQLTSHTVSTPDQILKQTKAATHRGYAKSVDEAFLGIISLGAPVRAADRSIVGAVSIAYPRNVGGPHPLTEVGDLIASAAARISAAL